MGRAGRVGSSSPRGRAGRWATFGTSPECEEARGRLDAEYDIVVCGGGGAGLPTALFSRWLGNSVVILEKAATLGGTSFKAAYWYWVPNNAAMRKAGMPDSKEAFLSYVARLSAPQTFDPNHPRKGLNEWEYSMCEAIYDSASEGTELLASKDALPYRHVAPVPDYFAELETVGATGRVPVPEGRARPCPTVGAWPRAPCPRRAGATGGHQDRPPRAEVIRNEKGEVIGVEATAGGGVFRARVRKAVIFATGGFTHDPELRKNFLAIPAYGGCAAMTNEGDFVRISSSLGVAAAQYERLPGRARSRLRRRFRDPSMTAACSRWPATP
jgi:glycine/D-amino acid oxidase-like deaminating enzyme